MTTDNLDRDHDQRNRLLVTEHLRLHDGDPDGDLVVLAVDITGETSVWILRVMTAEAEASALHGDARGASHEQAGRLPDEWQRRIQLTPLRCARPTLAGRLCRLPVAEPGAACVHHRPRVSR